MWRFVVLAVVAFVCGLLQSSLALDPREAWQIPAAVGLAVYLALLSLRPKPPKRQRIVPVARGEPPAPSPFQFLRARLASIVSRASGSAKFRVWILAEEDTAAQELATFASDLKAHLPEATELKCLVTFKDEASVQMFSARVGSIPALTVAALDPLTPEYPFRHKFDLIIAPRIVAGLTVSQRVSFMKRLKTALADEGYFSADLQSSKLLRSSQWRFIAPGVFQNKPVPTSNISVAREQPATLSQ